MFYTEESYERDKARLVVIIREHINDVYSLNSLDLVEILHLIEQSRWIEKNVDKCSL